MDRLRKLKDLLFSDYQKVKDNIKKDFKEDSDEELDKKAIGPLVLEHVGFKDNDRAVHHTERYREWSTDNPTPVYRRCEHFSLAAKFNRDFNPDLDNINVIFSYGPSASIQNGTKHKIKADHSYKVIDKDQWSVQILMVSINCHDRLYQTPALTLKVMSPVNCQVGLWQLQVVTSMQATTHTPSENVSKKINFYLLFNPWSIDDEVYLESEQERQRYVMDNYGEIFNGTTKMVNSRPWIYGQFDFAVLPATILLLEQSSRLSLLQRGSATLVSRDLSQMIHNVGKNDDEGLLKGSWKGSFSKGVDPTAWTGSVAIFDQYLQTRGRTVKYAQCWVFAGCLTTACRALGIPCRTVTCFNSANDMENNLVIERYIGNTRMKIQNSLWNFQCWNEVWLSRPDLPRGYGGWQVIDGMSQETSVYNIGPTSIKAIKEGELGLDYDAQIVFAKVNADIDYYIEDELVCRDITSVGKHIVTYSGGKAVSMDDVTQNYKYAGDFQKEIIYPKVPSEFSPYFYQEEPIGIEHPKDVHFKLKEIDSVAFGQPFSVVVDMYNTSNETKTVQASLYVTATDYTGRNSLSFKTEGISITLEPNDKKEAKLDVAVEDYKDKVRYTPYIKMATVCSVKETLEVYANEDVFEVVSPKLEIQISSKNITLNSTFNVVLSFKNPLDEELVYCRLAIEGSGMLRPTTLRLKDVPAKGDMYRRLEVRPRLVGQCTLVCIFYCKQLANVIGSVSFVVNE